MAAQQAPSTNFSMHFPQKLHGFDGFLFKFEIGTPAPTRAQAFQGVNPNPRLVEVMLIGLIDQPRQRCPLATFFVELPNVHQNPDEAMRILGDFGFCGGRLYQWNFGWAAMAGILALGVGHVDANIAERNDGTMVERAQRRCMVAATRATFLHLIEGDRTLYDRVLMQVNNPRDSDGIFGPERMLKEVFEDNVPSWHQTARWMSFDQLREMVVR